MRDFNRRDSRDNRSGGRPQGGGFVSRGFGSRPDPNREMFSAVCDKCGKSCQVPFRPSNGKPVLCSDCFRESRGSEGRLDERRDRKPMRDFRSNPADTQSASAHPQYKEQFEALNAKLDKILSMLGSTSSPRDDSAPKEKHAPVFKAPKIEEVNEDNVVREEDMPLEKVVKVVKKKAAKKKEAVVEAIETPVEEAPEVASAE